MLTGTYFAASASMGAIIRVGSNILDTKEAISSLVREFDSPRNLSAAECGKVLRAKVRAEHDKDERDGDAANLGDGLCGGIGDERAFFKEEALELWGLKRRLRPRAWPRGVGS